MANDDRAALQAQARKARSLLPALGERARAIADLVIDYYPQAAGDNNERRISNAKQAAKNAYKRQNATRYKNAYRDGSLSEGLDAAVKALRRAAK